MANYNTTANVTLSVNGRQAQQVLSTLQRDAVALEKKLARAASAGDKASMRKLQRELNNTNRMITQLQGSAASVEQVLSRLDSASPRELQRSLKTLQQQLNSIERGSSAWNAQVEKIKAVKMELQKVNQTLTIQQSKWDRMNMWLNNAQTFLMGMAGALTGLVMAGRKAVNAFAEIEEELANTRKYTGLTVDKVNELNEAFLKMDTRTSREKLNELAQEAGRLGKNTLESVLGYVEAADIINVALVDLGDGATQTIAKLTNIFGVEEMLGTKDAMLAVGSTVNVLSQNCTASKPYLVEFAQRMAGIGSQAGLTIPQILAFGAVLDANGQKVEMSATAIQKVLMNLASKNREFAATLGMDAEKLNETLKHSAKDGLIMFLETLQSMGKDVGFENATMMLAPAFKEMGLDAARVSQVLSTLAMHLDEVKWQMGEASKAFNEASSATREYEIFNNTVQAAIDKARKRVGELAIELGEKLYPIMKHIYTSSGIFLRVLNSIVSFIIKYAGEILALTAAIAAYNVAVHMATIRTKSFALWTTTVKVAQQAWLATQVLANAAMALFRGRIHAATQEFKLFSAVLRLNPLGLVTAAVTALIAGLVVLISRSNEAAKVQKTLNDIKQDAVSKLEEERSHIDRLVAAAHNERLSLDERHAAIEKLNKIIPNYNGQLDDTTGKYKENKEALDDYIKSLTRKYEIEGAKEKLGEIGRKRAEITTSIADTERELSNERSYAASYSAEVASNPGRAISTNGAGSPAGFAMINSAATIQGLEGRIESLKGELRLLQQMEEAITGIYGDDIQRSEITSPTTNNNNPNPTYTPNQDPNADRFATEKLWREEQEALARIAYATGKKDYLAYTAEMDRIAIEFYRRQLEHTDLSEMERLSISAQWYEAQKKRTEHVATASLEGEQRAHAARLAEVRQFYIDGQLSKETYDNRIEELEIEHQRNIVNLYAVGSQERVQAQQRLDNLLIAQMQRRQRATEEAERKIAAMKKEFFGDNPAEQQAKYDADLALLKSAYEREIAAAGNNANEKLRIEEAFQQAKLALQKRYGLLAEEDSRNSLHRAIDESVEWLNSDGGKAMQGAISTLTSNMSAMFSSLSSIVQAELELQTAAIESRYDAEISAAEGNSFRIRKLEKQKEEEIAKAKNEANRKMFAMQVIQAVAQTAQNAISAYGSAAAVPIIGYILAPIAAAMAVAAGAIQIASIKKQQQAAAAQGYASGGFTPDGDVDEPVGIVHAGEWVASQRLVKNPVTRPLLEALDYAQRNNTIGSLSSADVSRSITAPMLLASHSQQPSQPNVVVNVPPQSSENSKIEATLDRLNSRLNEPFVTINTVAGDYGIEKAQADYNKLIKNKSPKSRK